MPNDKFAIVDLGDLPDEQLFANLTEGLRLVHEHVAALAADAKRLVEQGSQRGPRILSVIGEEEAGKFLILMDAARCPGRKSDALRKHLNSFGDHVAKGIYAESCNGMMGSFGSHRGWIEDERKEFYLDGPNDVDWLPCITRGSYHLGTRARGNG